MYKLITQCTLAISSIVRLRILRLHTNYIVIARFLKNYTLQVDQNWQRRTSFGCQNSSGWTNFGKNFCRNWSGVIGMHVSLGKMFPAHVSLGMRVSPYTYHWGCVFPISDTCFPRTNFTREACFLDCSATHS